MVDNYYRETLSRQGGGLRLSILTRLVKKGLLEKVTSEKGSEEGELGLDKHKV